MADFQLVHRPAVHEAFASSAGAVTLQPLPEGRVIQVLGKPAGDDLRQILTEFAGTGPHGLRSAGPGQWFIVGDSPMTHDEFQAMAAKLAQHAFLVDQSHGRVRVGLKGTRIVDVLAKGTGVDLDRVAVGESAMTLVGHISVHLTRLAPDAIELMVLRGFAESLWDDLVRMSREFA
ncbi:sarcosine oxidase subunit gamma [Rhizobium sp. TH2]|uniref:sarcosine oxidase subunit gamma n=1 Tax=Rhizobium sp. TH2 TaxID=2775403 RepID=UPI002157BDEF|nr:sarcosine oxidase subunit gamma [Rhizobium sp. TH2]UVC08565.1 sarcosine oxidase subunit gamma [Rhizobium sp. TH2]